MRTRSIRQRTTGLRKPAANDLRPPWLWGFKFSLECQRCDAFRLRVYGKAVLQYSADAAVHEILDPCSPEGTLWQDGWAMHSKLF